MPKWDDLPGWSKEQIAALVEKVKADFDVGNLGKELSAKLTERVIPEREAHLTITSGKSIIGVYDYTMAMLALAFVMAKKQKRDWFQTYLHDYEATVAKFIPATPPKTKEERSDLYDDVLHVLDIRSELEKILDAQPELAHYRERLADTDALLWQKRATVVDLLSPLSRWRKRWGCPASHWWWRLDELKRKPARINGRVKAVAAA